MESPCRPAGKLPGCRQLPVGTAGPGQGWWWVTPAGRRAAQVTLEKQSSGIDQEESSKGKRDCCFSGLICSPNNLRVPQLSCFVLLGQRKGPREQAAHTPWAQLRAFFRNEWRVSALHLMSKQGDLRCYPCTRTSVLRKSRLRLHRPAEHSACVPAVAHLLPEWEITGKPFASQQYLLLRSHKFGSCRAG